MFKKNFFDTFQERQLFLIYHKQDAIIEQKKICTIDWTLKEHTKTPSDVFLIGLPQQTAATKTSFIEKEEKNARRLGGVKPNLAFLSLPPDVLSAE